MTTTTMCFASLFFPLWFLSPPFVREKNCRSEHVQNPPSFVFFHRFLQRVEKKKKIHAPDVLDPCCWEALRDGEEGRMTSTRERDDEEDEEEDDNARPAPTTTLEKKENKGEEEEEETAAATTTTTTATAREDDEGEEEVRKHLKPFLVAFEHSLRELRKDVELVPTGAQQDAEDYAIDSLQVLKDLRKKGEETFETNKRMRKEYLVIKEKSIKTMDLLSRM